MNEQAGIPVLRMMEEWCSHATVSEIETVRLHDAKRKSQLRTGKRSNFGNKGEQRQFVRSGVVWKRVE
jgi:hypothetical protein